jgi:hypothetical protein
LRRFAILLAGAVAMVFAFGQPVICCRLHC